MCYIYDVSVDDMGHYYLQITEVDDDTNIAHAKIDMNLFVKGDPIVAFGPETPRGLLSSDENHTFRCNVVSYPINGTKVSMKFKQCDGGDFVNCKGSPVPVTPSQAEVDTAVAPFTSDPTVVLGKPFGWSHGVLTCKACRKDLCAKDVTTVLLGDQEGSAISILQ